MGSAGESMSQFSFPTLHRAMEANMCADERLAGNEMGRERLSLMIAFFCPDSGMALMLGIGLREIPILMSECCTAEVWEECRKHLEESLSLYN